MTMVGNLHIPTPEDISKWPVPNYTNPVERWYLGPYAICWQIATTTFVAGRLYIRCRGRAGLDDLFLLISWLFSLGLTICACLSQYRTNLGRHDWDVTPDHYVPALFTGWLAQIMFMHSTGAIKVSVLLFYCRLARDYSKGWLYFVYAFLGMTVTAWVGFFFAYCLMCRPLSTYWDITAVWAANASYTCLDGDKLTIAISVLTIASDLWTVSLPCVMFQYHDLGVNKRQKIALNIIFCLGFLVTGGGIARTYYLWKIGHDQDISWNGYDLFLSSIAECNLAIMCTCAPFLRAFVRKHKNTIRNMTPLGWSSDKAAAEATVTTLDSNTSITTEDMKTASVNYSIPRQSSSSPLRSVFEDIAEESSMTDVEQYVEAEQPPPSFHEQPGTTRYSWGRISKKRWQNINDMA